MQARLVRRMNNVVIRDTVIESKRYLLFLARIGIENRGVSSWKLILSSNFSLLCFSMSVFATDAVNKTRLPWSVWNHN